jgi:hypothetical protein
MDITNMTVASGGSAVNDETKSKAAPGRVMDCWAAATLIKWASASNGRPFEVLRDELNRFAAELAGPNPSPTEQVLASTASLAWFDLRLAEVHALEQSGDTVRSYDLAQRRVDRAHRRLMSCLGLLATVRRLAVPSLRVGVTRLEETN